MADKREQGFEWVEDMKDFNKELEPRILEANQDDTKIKWRDLLPDLMDAEILMIGQFADNKETGEKQLNLLMMQKDGKIAVPFFTSPDKMGAFANQNQSKFDVIKMETSAFFRSIAGKAAVMNPMTTYSRIFTPFEITILTAEYAERNPDKKQ